MNALLATAAWIDGLSCNHARSDRPVAKRRRGGVQRHSERAAHRSGGQGRIRQCRPAAGLRSPGRGQRRELEARASFAHRRGGEHGGSSHGRRHSRRRCGWPAPATVVDTINAVTPKDRNLFLDASRLAEGLFASHMAVNILLLGAACQGGLIPISAARHRRSHPAEQSGCRAQPAGFLCGAASIIRTPRRWRR